MQHTEDGWGAALRFHVNGKGGFKYRDTHTRFRHGVNFFSKRTIYMNIQTSTYVQPVHTYTLTQIKKI